MASVPRFGNHQELRALAKRRLPRFLFDYVDRGTEDERGMIRNRDAFDRIGLVPRVMADVSARDASVEIFGQRWAMPVAIGPAASAAMLWYRGEAGLASAAAAAGIPYCLSGASSLAIEEAVALAPNTWFQLYPWKDLELTLQTIDRVAEAGAKALIITADSPTPPNREYNVRNGFASPFRVTRANALDIMTHPRWSLGTALRYVLSGGLPRYANVPKEMRTSVAGRARQMVVSDRFDWDAFATVRKRWQGPLLIKGVMHVEDTRAAARHGADGIVISNHGGRNLDSAPATLNVLPAIADAVGDTMVVLLDGGIRRGSDVMKAVALGARGVLAGRLPLFAASVGGEPAVAALLAMLAKEFDTHLGMTGCRSVAEVGADRVCDLRNP